mgnify:CR=1 FL=1
MRKKRNVVLEQVAVVAYAAGGKSIAKLDGKVVFIEGAVPGDVVDVRLSKNKKDWAKPLVIAVVEGRNTHKLTHLHLAIGNIPTTHLGNISQHIQAAFQRCDFANKQLCVKHVTSGIGWLGYITKEVGYTDNDALDIVSSTIPPFIQSSICAESRLLTE